MDRDFRKALEKSREIQCKVQENFKRFLEEFRLYRKCGILVPTDFDNFEFLPLQLRCPRCKAITTFAFESEQSTVSQIPVAKSRGGGTKSNVHSTDGGTVKIAYGCQHCRSDRYHFQVTFEGGNMIKSGQHPGPEIDIAPDIAEKLGEILAAQYKKGKVCESQGYGIGAMAYYRRVIEDKVRDLLEEIKDLISNDNQKQYQDVIREVMDVHSFEQKADFVYDILPNVLRPKGRNLLKLLFAKLSEGLHSKDDNQCLEIAGDLSQLLEMIIHILNTQAETAKGLERLERRITNSDR